MPKQKTQIMATTNHGIQTLKSKQIKLVDGEFSKFQASEVLNLLINQKINYHKIEGIQSWEQNHETVNSPIRNRIQELEQEKKKLASLLENLKDGEHKLQINGVIEIKVINTNEAE